MKQQLEDILNKLQVTFTTGRVLERESALTAERTAVSYLGVAMAYLGESIKQLKNAITEVKED